MSNFQNKYIEEFKNNFGASNICAWLLLTLFIPEDLYTWLKNKLVQAVVYFVQTF